MDVRLPDGTLIQGVPDGMSKADLTAKLKANGYDVSGLAEPAAPTRADLMKRELLRSPPVALARGVKDIVDTGAEWLARLVSGKDEQARVAAENKAGKAEFDAAVEGQFMPQLARFGGNVAVTAPVGPMLATGARVAGAGAPIVNALQSAGMTTGGRAPGVMNLLKDLALRSAAGGAVGGASTAMIDPEHAGTGAAIGAAMPPALAVAGKVGQVAGRVINGPAIDADTIAAIKAARSAGYVIPPTQAKPTLANRVLEGFSGKITTAQNASAKNQGVTAKLAAEALGLPGDTKITPDVLTTVRKAAGQAYDAIGGTGTVTPGVAYDAALDAIAAPHLKAAAGFPNAKASPVVDLVESLRSPTFDAAAAVAKIKELRSAADDAFRTGNTDIGRASKAAAKALEDVLDTHLQGLGSPDMLQQFRDARQLIAKTYSVEKALNPATGAIDARKLGAQIKAGKPLSGGLRDAGEFALRFPKAAQTVEGMGSLPQTSPLDWIPAGALSAATSNPLMMAGVFARPAARAAALSPMVQNRLATQNSLMQMLQQNPDALNLLYRSTPVGLAADR